jgi:hypothetical protein
MATYHPARGIRLGVVCVRVDVDVLGLRAVSDCAVSYSSPRLTRPLAHQAAQVQALLELHVGDGRAGCFRRDE